MVMWKQYILITIVILALVQPPSDYKRRILIDYSHGETVDQPFSGVEARPCLDIFEDTCEMVESHKELTYQNIQDYDVLLICSPQEDFISEIEAISRFVSNGGGLLIISGFWDPDYTELIPINSLSEFFGVEFTDQGLLRTSYTVEVESQNHPVFQDVKKISFSCPNFFTVKRPSEELLYSEEKGSLVASCQYGKGRVIFLPSSSLLLYPHVDVFDNEQFITNVFYWLAEPGGPYVQQIENLNKGLSLIEKGKEQLEAGEFTSARSTLKQSKNYLESALTIYESDTTENAIKSVEFLLTDCETGAKAESLLQEGVSLYESGDYSSALSVLQEAQQMFQFINVENEECSSLIQECEIEMENEKNREKAETYVRRGIAYFEEQQYDLAKARFEEALVIYRELQDSEKVTECEEWIASCEEVYTESTSFGIIIGVVIVLSAIAGIFIVQWKKRKGTTYEREAKKDYVRQKTKEPKPTKLRCPFCKNEIKEDWVSCPHCGARLTDDTQAY